MTRLPWLATFGAVCCANTGAAAAEPPRTIRLCAVGDANSADVAPLEELKWALQLEARKRETALKVVLAPCGEPEPSATSVVLLPGGGYGVWGESGFVAYEFAGVEPTERPAELARVLVESLAPEVGRATIVAEGDVLGPPAPPTPWALGIRVGGGWIAEGGTQNGASVDIEAFGAVWDGLVEFAAVGAWYPAISVTGEPTRLSRQAADLGLRARLGWVHPDWALRVGLGVGWQWRELRSDNTQRFELPKHSDGAFAVGGELEALWQPTERLQVILALPVRAHVGGTDWAWIDDVVYEAPRWSIGATMRFGVVLYQRARE